MHHAWRDERRGRQRELRALFALLRSDVINFSYCHPKERIKAAELLPAEDREREPQRRLTKKRRAEIADGIRKVFAPLVEEK